MLMIVIMVFCMTPVLSNPQDAITTKQHKTFSLFPQNQEYPKWIRPLCKPKKMTPKYRNFRLNFEISEISKYKGAETMKNSEILPSSLRIF